MFSLALEVFNVGIESDLWVLSNQGTSLSRQSGNIFFNLYIYGSETKGLPLLN